jgi:RNA polymerase sigma factor (sigma-70 family)
MSEEGDRIIANIRGAISLQAGKAKGYGSRMNKRLNMKTGNGTSSPITPYVSKRTQRSRLDWEQLDQTLLTIREEMLMGRPDSAALRDAIYSTFEQLAAVLYRAALSELTKLGGRIPGGITMQAEDITYHQLTKFMLHILPGKKFIYRGPHSAVDYIRKSIKYSASDLRRRFHNYAEVSLDELEEQGFEQGVEDSELVQAESDILPVDEVMNRAKLTEREKKVLKLTIEEGLKPREIVKIIEEKPERVSRILNRALTKLRKVVKRDEHGDWEMA